MSEARSTETLSLFTASPKTIASAMKRSEDDATPGAATNVPAIWRVNSVTTRTSVDQEKSKKRILPGLPSIVPIIVPIDSPSCRTERNIAIISCAEPMNMQPRIIHSATDAQPNSAASTGPTMGPAPAIEAKWCPRSTAGCAGT